MVDFVITYIHCVPGKDGGGGGEEGGGGVSTRQLVVAAILALVAIIGGIGTYELLLD